MSEQGFISCEYVQVFSRVCGKVLMAGISSERYPSRGSENVDFLFFRTQAIGTLYLFPVTLRGDTRGFGVVLFLGVE
jgi:hypothetical protein